MENGNAKVKGWQNARRMEIGKRKLKRMLKETQVTLVDRLKQR